MPDRVANVSNDPRTYLKNKTSRFLAEKGVFINCFAFKTGEPAIYLAAKYKLVDAVNLFLNRFYDVLDIDCYIDSNNKSARNLILKYKLYSHRLPSPTQNPYHYLFQTIFDHKVSMFMEYYRALEPSLSYHTKVMLLFRALNHGSSECFEFLLEEVSHRFQNYISVLEVACTKGYYKTVDSLLENTDINYGISLVKRIVSINKAVSDETNFINHVECLSLILEDTPMDLNEKDERGLTVLEYAIEHKNPKMISILLQYGASLIVSAAKGTLMKS